MGKDTTNYIILTEKMLGKLVNSRKVKVLYFLAGVEALVIWKQYKRIEDLKEHVDYWKDEFDRVSMESDNSTESIKDDPYDVRNARNAAEL